MPEKAVGTPLSSFINNKSLDIQELGIVLNAKNLNPQVVNLDFLKLSGVIPNDWELDRKPVITNRIVQLNFNSGVSIVAQPGTIAFSESVKNDKIEALQVAIIAAKCVDKLPNAQYQAVSIAPKNVIAFGDEPDAARNYVTECLLAPGAWRDLGKEKVQANLNLSYQLDKCQFNLSINEVRLQQAEKPTISGLLFSGSFNYPVGNYQGEELLTQMKNLIANWSTDLQNFKQIINDKFLGEPETIFPGLLG